MSRPKFRYEDFGDGWRWVCARCGGYSTKLPSEKDVKESARVDHAECQTGIPREEVACGVLHHDERGNRVPCPGYPHAEPDPEQPMSDESRRCPRCDCADGHTRCEHCKVCPHADGPDDLSREECPHCDEALPRNRVDQHVATAHADLPDCTARIDNEHGLYTCAFRAGHRGGEHGEWHASLPGPVGRYVWNDTAHGAIPSAAPERPEVEVNQEPESGDESRAVPPTDEELNTALPVRPDPRQPAYDAVYEYIRQLGPYLPPDPVHRNAVIWRAVNAALDATPVGRCVSSHCVEGGHILPVEGEAP